MCSSNPFLTQGRTEVYFVTAPSEKRRHVLLHCTRAIIPASLAMVAFLVAFGHPITSCTAVRNLYILIGSPNNALITSTKRLLTSED